MLRRTKKRSELAQSSAVSTPILTTEAGRSRPEEDVQNQERSQTRTQSQKRQKTKKLAVVGMVPTKVDTEESLLEKEVLGDQQSFVENLKRRDKRVFLF